mmetsp:Transcript_58294/g.125233  ORF Transcript_58294/g.125233 Transcript_58294/m.125233 type:complete len:300 (-) Transcript_58294:531-1430(-)
MVLSFSGEILFSNERTSRSSLCCLLCGLLLSKRMGSASGSASERQLASSHFPFDVSPPLRPTFGNSLLKGTCQLGHGWRLPEGAAIAERLLLLLGRSRSRPRSWQGSWPRRKKYGRKPAGGGAPAFFTSFQHLNKSSRSYGLGSVVEELVTSSSSSHCSCAISSLLPGADAKEIFSLSKGPSRRWSLRMLAGDSEAARGRARGAGRGDGAGDNASNKSRSGKRGAGGVGGRRLGVAFEEAGAAPVALAFASGSQLAERRRVDAAGAALALAPPKRGNGGTVKGKFPGLATRLAAALGVA